MTYSSVVTAGPTTPPTRLDRRKAQTRAALIGAAQSLMAEGRTNVPVQEITEVADLGTGSFYNHFESKEQLFAAATMDALEKQADYLALVTEVYDDPAVVFAQSFRLLGRAHRLAPQLSKVILSNGLDMVTSEVGMGAHARRDVEAAVEAGRFKVVDLDAAMVVVTGSALALGRLLHDQPDLDDAALTDQVAEDVLRVLGLTPRQAQKICALPLPEIDLDAATRPA